MTNVYHNQPFSPVELLALNASPLASSHIGCWEDTAEIHLKARVRHRNWLRPCDKMKLDKKNQIPENESFQSNENLESIVYF